MKQLVVGFVALLALSLTPLGQDVYRSGFETVDQAPHFELTSTGYERGNVTGPIDFNLTTYEGKTVLLDFMAIACTSCRLVEREVLEPIWADLKDDPNFELLSIDTWADPESGNSFGGETNEALRQFQIDHGHDWRHALDTDKVFRTYEAVSLPKIAVVGPEGQLVKEWTGQPSLRDVRNTVDLAMAGEAQSATVFRYDNIASGPALFILLGAVVGIASFFAPCSVGLIPAYMGFLLQRNDGKPQTFDVLRAGLATGLGIVSIYGVIAIMLWSLSLLGFGEAVSANIERLRPVMAALLIVFGLLMLRSGTWDAVAKKLGMGKVDGRRGFFAFGIGYGLAAFGCTGPLFLPILVSAFGEGPTAGLAAFLAYSLAIAGFVFLAAALVAGGYQTRLRAMLGKTELVTKISAVLLAGAGVWLLWFDYQAGILF
ncbi:MAG: cytochrome c biogenesis protein CcdA [Thermoplasmatota archaeon]